MPCSISHKKTHWSRKVVLRYLLFLVLMYSPSTSVFSQQNNTGKDSSLQSYRTKHLYNAYSIAREVLRMEKTLSDINAVIRIGQVDSIRALLSALVWYSNLQDSDVDLQMDSLGSLLGKSYNRLDSAYKKILPFIYDFAFFDFEDDAQFRDYIGWVINSNGQGFRNLRDSLRPYYAEKGKVKRYKKVLDSLKNVVKDTISTLNVNGFRNLNDTVLTQFKNELKNFADSFKILKDKKDTSTAYPVDSSYISDSIHLYNSWFILQSVIEQKLKDTIAGCDLVISRIRQRLTHTFRDKHCDSSIVKLLVAISNRTAGPVVHADFTNKSSEKMLMIEQGNYFMAKQSQTAAMELATPSFKLPSEAEMIEAVAIYLAKRVKQESVMWFFETIQKNAKNYELLKTFFPTTITLLQTNEVYDIPNLGAQWRYALSKDFIRMPRNVLTSEWFNKWYSIKINADRTPLDFLITTYDVCDLLNQQYSYNKLVEKMYLSLNKDAATGDGNITPATIFSVLYAFNQECFIPTSHIGTDSMKTRVMRYQDFAGLTKDEIEIMMSLMDMRYGKVFTPIWKNKGEKQFMNHKNDVESFRRWAGMIEAGISQFNKMQGDYIKMTNEIREGKKIDVVYSIFNVWDNLNTLLNIVLDSNVLDNDKLKKVARSSAAIKTYTSKAFEIYNQLSLKNYAGAIGSTISLVEDLLYTEKMFSFDMTQVKNVINVQGDKYAFDQLLDKYSNRKKEEKELAFDQLLDKYTNRQKEEKEMLIGGVLHKGFKYAIGAKEVFAEKVNFRREDSVMVNGIQFIGNAQADSLAFYIVQKMNRIDSFLLNVDSVIGGVKFFRGQMLKKINLIDSLVTIHKNDSLIYSIKRLNLQQNFVQSAIVFEKDRRALKLVRNLAGFLNDVMLTTEPKQLAKVVESYALPPGSYKRKRNSWFSIDLNAYVGVYWGTERVKRDLAAGGNSTAIASVYGVTAPIGLSFSRTFGKKLQTGDTLTEDMIRNPDKIRVGKNNVWVRRPMTWTLGISIVDLGAVVSYQFSNDSLYKGLPQKVKWEQFLSPGIKIGYGISGTPLIVSAGWQYTPKLRSFSDNLSTQNSSSRFSFSLLFDLPLVNLYQKSYWKSHYLKREK